MVITQKLIENVYLITPEDKFSWICNGILIVDANDGQNVLIDCNLKRRDFKALFKEFNGDFKTYYISHVHLDHVNNVHYFEKLVPEARIYCPIPEHEYMLDIQKFIETNGAQQYGVGEPLKKAFFTIMRFKELKRVEGFKPDASFSFDNVMVKTIHLPGHSPGHVAFSIESKESGNRKVLFAADTGLDDFGAFYGFKYNSIAQISKDVRLLEQIYLNDNYVLTSGHGDVFFSKNQEIFQNILNKIEEREINLKKMLNQDIPKKIIDLTLQGLIYSNRTIKKYQTFFQSEKLVEFWEYYYITNLLADLLEKGEVRKIQGEGWILT